MLLDSRSLGGLKVLKETKRNRHTHVVNPCMRNRYSPYLFQLDQIVKELTAVDPIRNKSEESKQLTGYMVIRKEPKIDMNSLKGKTYLTSLTTVRYFSFRRLSVGLVEIAVATGLLQGNLQEWSLVKRHPCEKIFGVQLAGGCSHTMTRATQMVVKEGEVDFVDFNLGCSLDLINHKRAGCVLANRSNRLLDFLKCMNAVAKFSYYQGRSDLETLLSSPASCSWIKISAMFLGPTPEGFLFVSKHNASAY
uniref:tRNA-dihydrouridine(47) synthase [NAD(P)(+)] n=1 Tax=Ditylenchus dipsaci TaxID=166011 RepID=A0A915DQL9_9BILA